MLGHVDFVSTFLSFRRISGKCFRYQKETLNDVNHLQQNVNFIRKLYLVSGRRNTRAHEARALLNS